jgi:hypothetical protein
MHVPPDSVKIWCPWCRRLYWLLGESYGCTVRCWTPMPSQVVPHDYPHAFCDEHADLARSCLTTYDTERERIRAIARYYRRRYGRRG